MGTRKTRREVLLGGIGVAAIPLLPRLANASPPGGYEGGTNPIVIGPTPYFVVSGTGRTVDVTVRPGSLDSKNDVYNIRIVESLAVKRIVASRSELMVELTNRGVIAGILPGQEYQWFSFEEASDGSLKDKPISFDLDSCPDTKTLTVCVYGPDNFTRSGMCTFVLLKT